jgi:hypothetical protein
MFRLLVLCVVIVLLGAVLAPSFRLALAWVLALLSLLMLGALARSAFSKRRGHRSPAALGRA